MIENQIRQFINHSGLGFEKLGQALSESPKFVLRWWNRPDELRLSDRHLANFATYLNTDLDTILQGKDSLEKLRLNFIEGPRHLNENYFEKAFSHVRTTAHIVRYLSIRFGRSKVDEALRNMGVHPCIYFDLNNKISIDYFVDLLEVAERMGLTPTEIRHLSSFMFLAMKDTELGLEFASARDYLECYDVLNRNFHNFDENFIYEMDLREDGFSLKIRPGEALERKIRNNLIDCTNLAIYRKIMVCWFPYLSGLAPLFGSLNKSLAFGDPFCVIEAKFPSKPSGRFMPPQIQIL